MKENHSTNITRAVKIPDTLRKQLTPENILVVEGQGTVIHQTADRVFAPEPRLTYKAVITVLKIFSNSLQNLAKKTGKLESYALELQVQCTIWSTIFSSSCRLRREKCISF